MPKFKKKPIEIEAYKLINDMTVFEEVAEWCDGELHWDEDDPPYIIVHTTEGDMQAGEDWWIIKGVEGEFYPCKDSVFKESYEQVD